MPARVFAYFRRLLPGGGSADFLHWLYLVMALILPLVFSLSIIPAFSALKTAFFIAGTAALLLTSLLWLRTRARVEPDRPAILSLRREHIYLLCFTAWLFLSLLWAPDFSAALAKFLSSLAAVFIWFLYLVFYENEDKDNRRQFTLIQVIVVAGMLEAAIILLQYFGLAFQFSAEVGGSWRVIGTFGNPTFAAEFLVAVFFLALNLLHHETNILYRRFYSSAVLFIFLAIVATWSRSGIILLCLGLVFYSWIFARVKGQSIKMLFRFIYERLKSYFLLLCVGLTLILVIYPFLSMDRGLVRQVIDLNTVSERVFIWERALEALLDNFPLGTGVGGYSAAHAEAQYTHFSSERNFDLKRAGGIQEHAHNELLEFAVELGLGCVFIALFFGRIIRRGMRSFRADDLSIGSFTALALLLLSSCINFPMQITPTLYLLVILSALVCMHRRMEDDTGVREIRLPVISKRIFAVSVLLAAFAITCSFGMILSSYALHTAVSKIEKGEHASALDALKLSVIFNPANAQAQARLAVLAYDSGDEARAFRASQKSIRILPQAEAYRIQALLAEGQGRGASALEYWRKRSYVYRWAPGYTADYIRSLLDVGGEHSRGGVFQESLAFNELIARLGINSGEWADAAARVNGVALMARLSPGLRRAHLPDAALALGALGNTIYAADANSIFAFRDDIQGEPRFIENHGGSFCGFVSAGGGLLYASSDSIIQLDPDERRSVFARGITGIRSLAADTASGGEAYLAGTEDGRLLLVRRYGGASLLAQYARAVTAIAAAAPRTLFLALEGGGILQLDRASMREERVLDESEGILPGTISSLAVLGDTLLFAVPDAGVYSFDLASGTVRHSLSGREMGYAAPIRHVLPALPGQDFVLALEEGRLALLSDTGRALLSLEGGPYWPRRIRSALLSGGVLVVSGENGILLYPGFAEAIIPYTAYLEAAQ